MDEGLSAAKQALLYLADDARWCAARRVGLFASAADEPQTRPLFEAARRVGHEVLFARCIDGHRLDFAPVSDWSELRPGRYGLAEPTSDAWSGPWQAGDLVLVPGLAFDDGGGRLGRGMGYYDRSFEGCVRGAPWLLGFAFAFQIVEQVPMESLDRRVDGVVTEVGLSWRSEEADA